MSNEATCPAGHPNPRRPPGGRSRRRALLEEPARRRRWRGRHRLRCARGRRRRLRHLEAALAPPGPASFESARVDRGRIAVQVSASGTLSGLRTVQVGSQVSGRIAELSADFNDTVKKGQLLARLDTQIFKAAVEQSRASAVVAQSNVAQAQAQAADAETAAAPGQRKLGEAQLLAPEVVESATTAAEVARARPGGGPRPGPAGGGLPATRPS